MDKNKLISIELERTNKVRKNKKKENGFINILLILSLMIIIYILKIFITI